MNTVVRLSSDRHFHCLSIVLLCHEVFVFAFMSGPSCFDFLLLTYSVLADCVQRLT